MCVQGAPAREKFAGLLCSAAFASLFLLAPPAAALEGHAEQLVQADDQDGGGEQDLFIVPDQNDPLETPNRFVFAINEAADFLVIRPVATLYDFVLPDPLKTCVQSFLRNLSSPVILANDLMQGEWDRAEITATRFFINSIAGLGGIADVAGSIGHEYHDEDFGQTLAVYGVGEGFYLVLPLLGPSNPRDGVGLVVDSLIDPVTYLAGSEFGLGRTIVGGVDKRARNIELIEELRRDSVDFYARIRSLYRQNRANEIRNGAPAEGSPTPGFSDFDFTSEQTSQLY
ncbi:MAG: MlaA family lipoprotein [Kiloniellales bacterium]